jgi:hypothetical protein
VIMRGLIVALALIAAACSPAPAPSEKANEPNASGSAGQAEAPDPERDAMIAALSPRASEEIGIPVTFTVNIKRTQGEWGWLIAQPWTPDGAQIDWSTTRYATQAQEGMLDGNGTTYALLRKQAGQWSVVALAVGPTDVAYADWPQRYGAPPALLDLPPR